MAFALAVAVLGGVAVLRAPAPQDWWRTPDQRAAAAYAAGDFRTAAALFSDPAWRGAACARAGKWTCAELGFADSAGQAGWRAEAAYNRGVVAARAGKLATSLAHFDAALAVRPDWAQARDNRARVLAAMAEASRRAAVADAAGEPNETPDGEVVDERGERGKPGRLRVEQLRDQTLAALWLRNVRSDPGAFLRLRFAAEQRQRDTGTP